ncbi:MAG: PAS domain S-box protein [Hydrogenophilus sp.]|nr:PAS domain S-box protein [Hydrogenophilus sp.]
MNSESLLAHWRAVLLELLLEVGQSLDAAEEQRRFVSGVMSRLAPLACAFVREGPAVHFEAIPRRFPWERYWRALRERKGEETGFWTEGLPDGSVAHVWPLRLGEWFVIVTANSERYPEAAMRELQRLLQRVAITLTACDQHRMVQELAAAKRIHDRLFELSPGAIVVTDPQQRIVDVNSAFSRITGYTREEVIGKTPRILSSGRHDRAFYARMWASINTRGHWVGEIWNRKKDGSLYPELLTVVAVPDEQGIVQGYVAVFTEISEQKQREQELVRLQYELRRSNDYLQAILDHLGEGIYTLDDRGRCTFFNAAASQILGWRSEEVLGKNLHDLIHHHTAEGRFVPAEECVIRRAFLEGRVYRSENETFWHKSGKPIPVRVVAAPLYRDGKIVASVAVFDDITKQKEIEAQLRRAKEEAERLAKMKSEFLSVMSHEIRTPLNGVIGAIDLLLGTPLDNEQQDYARTIRASAETLLSVINDILDFSKLEAGAVTLESLPVSLEDLAKTVIEIARPLVKHKPVALQLALSEPLPVVQTDAVRLRQVLLNLVSNACKFTPKGAVTVTVEEVDRQQDRATIQFSVRDTGVGMTPEVQARLFQPFEQGDSSVTRRFGGTGLGLAIVKRIVDLMGGTIAVQSTPGEGATFTVRVAFPLAAAAGGASARQQVEQSVGGGGYAEDAKGIWNGVRVLLVEDNPVNQRVAARMLERLGLEVTVAGNGEEALARYAEEKPRLIFMDCQMPVMDGFAATAALRSQWGKEPPPVIVALTANASEEDRQRCLAAGMDDYLAKPVTLAGIESVLVRWRAMLETRAGTEEEQEEEQVEPRHATEREEIPLLNENRLTELFGDDKALIKEIFSLFVASAKGALARLGVALAVEPPQWEAIPPIAHELQGAGGNVGAEQVVAVAKRLSTAAKAKDRAEVTAARDRLAVCLREIEEWVRGLEG